MLVGFVVLRGYERDNEFFCRDLIDGFGEVQVRVTTPVENGGFEGEVRDDGGEVGHGAV